MPSRSYRIAALRPAGGELLVEYREGEGVTTLNLPAPERPNELHRHIMRHWPRAHFRNTRNLARLALWRESSAFEPVEVTSIDVDMFQLEDTDE